jgi:hypothetical protein
MVNLKRQIVASALVLSVASLSVYAGAKIVQQAVDAARWILERSVTYSENADYSRTIPHVLLGHNAEGETVQGVAMRSFKTYKKVTAMIALKKVGGQLVVDVVDIPDIGVIKDLEKQEKVLSALKGMSGKVVLDADGQQHKIDAVTGATRYQSRIFLYMNKMAEALVGEMTQDPGWPRQAVKTE